MAKDQSTPAQRIVAGLALILATDLDALCDIHGDAIYVGEPKRASKEQKAAIKKLGWTIDEDAWCFRT